MRESKGGGGTGSPEPPGKQHVLGKKAIEPHHLGKGWTPDIFDPPPPPLGLWKNYSFFEINIGPPTVNKLSTKKLSGLFYTSWARTAHHPGENSWIHACTHVAIKHARVCTCILLYVCFVFGNYRSSYVMVKMIRGERPREQGYCSKGNKGTFVHTCISCIKTHMRKIRVDEYITLILQFAQRACISVSPKSWTKGTYNTYGNTYGHN